MWTALKQEIAGLLFPAESKCPLCEKRKAREVCAECENQIQTLVKEDFCRKCGKLIGNTSLRLLCQDCLSYTYNFVFARGVGPYEGIFREAVWRLKYDGRRSLAPFMARFMAVTLAGEHRLQAINLVVPVPLAATKLIKRRFNQAELLARFLAENLGLPAAPRLLSRVVDTAAQSKMDRRARFENIKGIFAITNPALVQGQRILLVDDVFTTGATANECSRLLMKAGAAGVYVITWATGKEVI